VGHPHTRAALRTPGREDEATRWLRTNASTTDSPQLREALPEGWAEQFLGGAEARLTLESDLQLDGQSGSPWLLATDDRVLVVDRTGGAPEVQFELPLDQIEKAEADHYVGNGYLYWSRQRGERPSCASLGRGRRPLAPPRQN